MQNKNCGELASLDVVHGCVVVEPAGRPQTDSVSFSFHRWMWRCPLALLGVLPAAADFLFVSGMTANAETCLVSNVWLDSCENAVASLSGKEIWSLASDANLVHTASKKCLRAHGQTNADAPAELVQCDAAGGVPKWELEANGQMKMVQSSMFVGHLEGSNSVVNAAAATAASASASSTLDPALAIEGVASTGFRRWAR